DPNNTQAVNQFNNDCASFWNNGAEATSYVNACAAGGAAGAATGVWVAGVGAFGGALLGCAAGAYVNFKANTPTVNTSPGDAVSMPGKTVYSCGYTTLYAQTY